MLYNIYVDYYFYDNSINDVEASFKINDEYPYYEAKQVLLDTLATIDMKTYGVQNEDIAPYYIFQFLYLLVLPEKNSEKGQTIDKLITNIDITVNGVNFSPL